MCYTYRFMRDVRFSFWEACRPLPRMGGNPPCQKQQQQRQQRQLVPFQPRQTDAQHHDDDDDDDDHHHQQQQQQQGCYSQGLRVPWDRALVMGCFSHALCPPDPHLTAAQVLQGTAALHNTAAQALQGTSGSAAGGTPHSAACVPSGQGLCQHVTQQPEEQPALWPGAGCLGCGRSLDLNDEGPDLSACLLHQKLQVGCACLPLMCRAWDVHARGSSALMLRNGARSYAKFLRSCARWEYGLPT